MGAQLDRATRVLYGRTALLGVCMQCELGFLDDGCMIKYDITTALMRLWSNIIKYDHCAWITLIWTYE